MYNLPKLVWADCGNILGKCNGASLDPPAQEGLHFSDLRQHHVIRICANLHFEGSGLALFLSIKNPVEKNEPNSWHIAIMPGLQL